MINNITFLPYQYQFGIVIMIISQVPPSLFLFQFQSSIEPNRPAASVLTHIMTFACKWTERNTHG